MRLLKEIHFYISYDGKLDTLICPTLLNPTLEPHNIGWFHSHTTLCLV
jgi:hypothetical protein